MRMRRCLWRRQRNLTRKPSLLIDTHPIPIHLSARTPPTLLAAAARGRICPPHPWPTKNSRAQHQPLGPPPPPAVVSSYERSEGGRSPPLPLLFGGRRTAVVAACQRRSSLSSSSSCRILLVAKLARCTIRQRWPRTATRAAARRRQRLSHRTSTRRDLLGMSASLLSSAAVCIA